MPTKKRSKATVKKSRKKPTRRPRVRVQVRPAPVQQPAEVPVPQPSPVPAMKWPAQLDLVARATREALAQCDADEARSIADYMIDVGMAVVRNVSQKSLLLVVQDAPMHRLLNAITAHATNSRQAIDDVVTALITRLGPDAVEESRLN